jgi:hypothetical protein
MVPATRRWAKVNLIRPSAVREAAENNPLAPAKGITVDGSKPPRFADAGGVHTNTVPTGILAVGRRVADNRMVSKSFAVKKFAVALLEERAAFVDTYFISTACAT